MALAVSFYPYSHDEDLSYKPHTDLTLDRESLAVSVCTHQDFLVFSIYIYICSCRNILVLLPVSTDTEIG